MTKKDVGKALRLLDDASLDREPEIGQYSIEPEKQNKEKKLKLKVQSFEASMMRRMSVYHEDDQIQTR